MNMISIITAVSLIGLSALGFLKLTDMQIFVKKQNEFSSSFMEVAYFFNAITSGDKKCNTSLINSSNTPIVLVNTLGTEQNLHDISFNSKGLFKSNHSLNKFSTPEVKIKLVESFTRIKDIDNIFYQKYLAKILFHLISKDKKIRDIKSHFFTEVYLNESTGEASLCLKAHENSLNYTCQNLGGKIVSGNCSFECPPGNYLQGLTMNELNCRPLPTY